MKLKEKFYTIKLKKAENNSDLENAPIQNEDYEGECDHSSKYADREHLPVKLEKDPFKKEMHKCVFCKYKIPIDYKNVQLLSQFVSPHTGIVYRQEVTGLCHFKQSELERTVNKAKKIGLMPFFYKETDFRSDHEVFNPFSTQLKNIPDNFDKRKLNSE